MVLVIWVRIPVPDLPKPVLDLGKPLIEPRLHVLAHRVPLGCPVLGIVIHRVAPGKPRPSGRGGKGPFLILNILLDPFERSASARHYAVTR